MPYSICYNTFICYILSLGRNCKEITFWALHFERGEEEEEEERGAISNLLRQIEDKRRETAALLRALHFIGLFLFYFIVSFLFPPKETLKLDCCVLHSEWEEEDEVSPFRVWKKKKTKKTKRRLLFDFSLNLWARTQGTVTYGSRERERERDGSSSLCLTPRILVYDCTCNRTTTNTCNNSNSNNNEEEAFKQMMAAFFLYLLASKAELGDHQSFKRVVARRTLFMAAAMARRRQFKRLWIRRNDSMTETDWAATCGVELVSLGAVHVQPFDLLLLFSSLFCIIAAARSAALHLLSYCTRCTVGTPEVERWDHHRVQKMRFLFCSFGFSFNRVNVQVEAPTDRLKPCRISGNERNPSTKIYKYK